MLEMNHTVIISTILMLVSQKYLNRTDNKKRNEGFKFTPISVLLQAIRLGTSSTTCTTCNCNYFGGNKSTYS